MAFIKGLSFESGTIYEFTSINGGVTASTTQARTGTYSAMMGTIGSELEFYGTVTVPAADEYYIQFAVYPLALISDFKMFRWKSGSTVLGGLKAGSGIVTAWTGDFASQVGTATATFSINQWNLFEVRIKIADSGIIQIKINGTLVIDYSGDTKPGSETTIDTFDFCKTGFNVASYYDDIVFHDTSGTKNNSWPNGVRGYASRPTGAGTTTELTASAGNNWDCVEEVPVTSTAFVYPTADEQLDLYVMADCPAEVTYISAVQFEIIGQLNGAPTVNRFKRAARQDAVNYFGSNLTLPNQFGRAIEVLETAPDGTAWTPSKFNGLEIGMKSDAV